MCLGIPGELLDVRSRDGLRVGTVRFGAVEREVCLDYVPDATAGEYVVVHVGFAISRIDRAAAERAYRVLEDLGETADLGPPERGAG
jgi:hydrogenase expression/formation protein HypC